jgi:hypothetical protein
MYCDFLYDTDVGGRIKERRGEERRGEERRGEEKRER